MKDDHEIVTESLQKFHTVACFTAKLLDKSTPHFYQLFFLVSCLYFFQLWYSAVD